MACRGGARGAGLLRAGPGGSTGPLQAPPGTLPSGVPQRAPLRSDAMAEPAPGPLPGLRLGRGQPWRHPDVRPHPHPRLSALPLWAQDSHVRAFQPWAPAPLQSRSRVSRVQNPLLLQESARVSSSASGRLSPSEPRRGD